MITQVSGTEGRGLVHVLLYEISGAELIHLLNQFNVFQHIQVYKEHGYQEGNPLQAVEDSQ